MDPLSVAMVFRFLFVRSLGKSTLLDSSWRRIRQNSLHSYFYNILAQAQAKGFRWGGEWIEKLRGQFLKKILSKNLAPKTA